MGYQLLIAPTAEPLELVDAKAHMRVSADDTSEDLLITSMIRAARQKAEQLTQRSLITQTWKYVFDCFDDCYPLLLAKGPHQSISSIVYKDMAGADQTLATTDYVYDLSGPLARITPTFGKSWPVTLPQIAACSVTFVAGYGGEAEDVPEGIRQWMLLRIATLYEHREEFVTGTIVSPLPHVDCLLEPYRVIT